MCILWGHIEFDRSSAEIGVLLMKLYLYRFTYLTGAIAVLEGPSSISWFSSAESVFLRPRPKVSAEASPFPGGGPHFFPMTDGAPQGIIDRGGEKESTIKVPAR